MFEKHSDKNTEALRQTFLQAVADLVKGLESLLNDASMNKTANREFLLSAKKYILELRSILIESGYTIVDESKKGDPDAA